MKKTITDIKKDLVEIQLDVAQSTSIPSDFQLEILSALREAWYNLTLAGTLIEEVKVFENI